MTKQEADKLKQLILNEMAFRKEFKEKRKALEDLAFPITEHVEECCRFWQNALSDPEEIIVIMDNGASFKLLRPKYEACRVSTYLPFGMEYKECNIIDISE